MTPRHPPSSAVSAVAAVSAVLLAAGLGATTAAAAAPVTLDFEGVTSFAPIANFYAGGTDGTGVAGPLDLGIAFTGSALALSNDALGPYFSNAPSPGTVMFATDAAAFLNVASGFAGTVSFWYSSTDAAADAVTVWSGLNGTGTRLAASSLPANAQSGCSDSPYCRWTQTALTFAGTGHSIGFGGNAGSVAFDNVTIAPVPEPTTAALLALGLAGLAVGARTRRHPGR